MDKTLSPGDKRWITADVAALPDENATLERKSENIVVLAVFDNVHIE